MGNNAYHCKVGTIRSVGTHIHYFEEFFEQQSQKVRDKIIWTFELIEEHERIPKTYFDHLSDGIYEIRNEI